jgi:hypothetical protein
VITHAGAKYARLWKQILGFRDAEGKEPACFEGHEPYYEIHKDLEPSANAITTEAEAIVPDRGALGRAGAVRNLIERELTLTVVTAINPDWRVLCEEITAQALAACEKLEMAIGSATEPPPLNPGEALEDAANQYLNLFEEISEMHRKAHHPEKLG